MPNKKFLEQYPLYRKVDFDISKPFFHNYGGHSGTLIGELPKPSINMSCPICTSTQTFNMINDYEVLEQRHPKSHNQTPVGKNFELDYTCMGCKQYHYYFYIDFGVQIKKDKEGNEVWSNGWIRKIGQKPQESIDIDPQLERILGDNVEIYKKGLICESQSYGIGAYSYYRRVIENIIAFLLEEIRNLIPDGEEKDKYIAALDTTKKEKVATIRLELVKEVLPRSLYFNGENPLNLLYETASVGIHEMDDDECLEYAEAIRACLTSLIKEIEAHKKSSKEYSDGIKKLLSRKSKK